MTRKYSSISVQTTTASAISPTATTLTVATGTASALLGGVTLSPGNVDQFSITIDPDTVNEEIVFVTAVSSDTLTIVRGRGGTTGITHTGGATVKHVLTSDDLAYFTTGVDSAITPSSTSTFTNKDLSSGTNTFPSSLATLTGAQTLTNKTISDPAITETPNAQTGTTYTLVLSDAKQMVTLNNASVITVTIPPLSTTSFPIGTKIDFIQKGAGQVTFTAGAGVTIRSTGATAASPKLRTIYSGATAWYEGADIWYIVGDIA